MLRFAMCNEAFGERSFAEVCTCLRREGYDGIEIAPYTLTEPARELRAVMGGEGIEFVGLHWLLASPPGLHVTAADREVRRRSWEHVRSLVGLCAELASGPSMMVFGSPKQRATTMGTTQEEAVGRFTDGLREAAEFARERNVTILVEALPANQCDVIGTLAEAMAVVHAVKSPAVQTMFDTHNTADESEPADQLIERYFPHIRHVHVNEMDGRRPGSGDYDFRPVLGTLERLDYRGWISVEAFDFGPDAETIARESILHLKSLL